VSFRTSEFPAPPWLQVPLVWIDNASICSCMYSEYQVEYYYY